MFPSVTRRAKKPLVYLLAALQLLLAAPAATALSGAPMGAGIAEAPCAEGMTPETDSRHCPCCPDGVKSNAACLASCTAAVAAMSTIAAVFARQPIVDRLTTQFVFVAGSGDPPLKPPPIV
jgi:hypothetical protein